MSNQRQGTRSWLTLLAIVLWIIALPQNACAKNIYPTLDPHSVAEHLAYYELYPDTKEGQQALAHAWQLLSRGQIPVCPPQMTLPVPNVDALIALITRQPIDPPMRLERAHIAFLQELASDLGNRKLRGHTLWKTADLLALPPEEIDLARGLLLHQFEGSDRFRDEVEQYEVALDLMALQIRARLSHNADPQEKVQMINRFIFEEMHFRFPPHSLYAKQIDLYTFLPSVMDSREGVCLGVSILYLCIAQRLDLQLDVITPPGHIYLRFRNKDQVTNIETTARGIDLPSSLYLGVNTRHLPERTLKEVIGLAFVNQASVAWMQEKYQDALLLYQKALLYMPDDPLVQMLLGFQHLFLGNKQHAIPLLRTLREHTFDYAVSKETVPDDYLSGRADAEAIRTLYGHIDETHASILVKQKSLEQCLSKFPNFRSGLFHLAVTWLQLGRYGEALDVLQRYHQLDPDDVTVEYYLACISFERLDYNKAWIHLLHAETLCNQRAHQPKALRQLRQDLLHVSPPPQDVSTKNT